MLLDSLENNAMQPDNWTALDEINTEMNELQLTTKPMLGLICAWFLDRATVQ